jgi:hypothetical protein
VTGNNQDMKKQMTIFIFSAIIGIKFTLNNTRHASEGFGPARAPRRVTYFKRRCMNEKKTD